MELAGLEVELVRKEIKNLHLAVYPPDGRIRLAAPIETDSATLEVYLASKIPWIRKQQRLIERQPRQSPRQFVDGESHYFKGRRYLLRVQKSEGVQTRQRVKIVGKRYLNLSVSDPTSLEAKQSALEGFYREELRALLAEFIPEWETRLGVKSKKWRVQSMRTKWGSCNPKMGTLLFNLELAKLPVECVEYVVAHELAHLIERTHNATFQNVLNQHLPNWRVLKEQMAETPIAKQL